MKNTIISLIAMVLLMGCAERHPKKLDESLIAIKPYELKLSDDTLYIAEASVFENVVREENIALKEAPFEESYFVCGGVFPSEQDTEELLKNAKAVFVLRGSYEKWTPIEGKSKKYLVFKLQ